jgi:uncharacterized protein
MQGEITHIELGAPDAAKAKMFFGSLLGWTFEPFGDGEQAMFHTTKVSGGLHDGVPTASLTSYFQVGDIEQALGQVRDLGGSSEGASPEEPGIGRFANCVDDQGVSFGLHQPVAA